MAPRKPKSKVSNVTQEKLSELPFATAKELKIAQDEIRGLVWRRMEEARIINQMIKKNEYKFWADEFKKGLVCSYEETDTQVLVRVYSDEEGIHICINKGIAGTAPASDAVLGTLVKALSESFTSTLYRAKGILTPSERLANTRGESERP